nr:hypothetical protein [Deinococcus aestuarii]
MLGELDRDEGGLERRLAPPAQAAEAEPRRTEAAFRWALVEDQMAGEKLTEGLRLFHQDDLRLRESVQAKLARLSVPQAVPTP